MKKEKSVKKNYQYKRILKKGKITSTEYIRISYQNNNLSNNRLGIAIRKNVKSSILRNRLKRIIREVYRLNNNKLKQGFDVIILINKPIDDYNIMKVNIEKCFTRLRMYEEISY